MKKWQKNPWCVPSCIPPYDVTEYDIHGNKIFAKSYRRFIDAWTRFTKLSKNAAYSCFLKLNNVDKDMTLVFTNTNGKIENVVEFKNQNKFAS